ncbi:hypothetical protein ACTFIY_009684 [Dictyostelium cf. discoideum]
MVFDLTSIKGEHKEKIIYEEDDDEKMFTDWDDIIKYDSVQPKDADVVYILLCIDSFTKYATGRTIPIYHFLAGKYKVWHCDNGREFKNKVQKEFIKLFPGSKSAHGASRTPTIQGMVERLNQTIKERISKIKLQDFKEGKSRPIWEILEVALDNYNTISRTIKMTTAQAAGIKPLFNSIPLNSGSQLIGSFNNNNNNSNHVTKEQHLKVVDIVQFLENKNNKRILIKYGVNSTQKTGSYHGYVGANKLVLYKKSTIDINLNSDSPNIPNDLDSYTSSLYINNDKKNSRICIGKDIKLPDEKQVVQRSPILQPKQPSITVSLVKIGNNIEHKTDKISKLTTATPSKEPMVGSPSKSPHKVPSIINSKKVGKKPRLTSIQKLKLDIVAIDRRGQLDIKFYYKI